MRNLLLKIILMLFGIYLLFLPLNFHGSLILIFQYSSLNRQIYLHGLAPQQKKENQSGTGIFLIKNPCFLPLVFRMNHLLLGVVVD